VRRCHFPSNFGILHNSRSGPHPPTFYLVSTLPLPLLHAAGAEWEKARRVRRRSYERFVHFRKFVRVPAAINLYTAFGNFYDLRNFKFSFKIAYRRPLTPTDRRVRRERSRVRFVSFRAIRRTFRLSRATVSFLPSYLSPRTLGLPWTISPPFPVARRESADSIVSRIATSPRNWNARLIEPGASCISMKPAIDRSDSRVRRRGSEAIEQLPSTRQRRGA